MGPGRGCIRNNRGRRLSSSGEQEETMRNSQVLLAVVLCTVLSHRPASAQDAAAAANTTKLQELIDKAKPGGEVIVPKGEFSDPLRIDKPLKLRGEARDASVIDVTADEPAIRLAHGKGEVT